MDLNRPCSTMTVELIDYIQNNPQTVYHMDQFLARYQNTIFNFIRLTVHDYHDSLDITNKVLLTLSQKVREVEQKKSFNYLAIKVIKGEISNYWKGRKTHKAKMVKHATIWHNDEEISLVETLESKESKAEEIFNLLMIRDMIENHSDPHMREVFLLKYRDEKSIADIAVQLSLTEYQVKRYLADIQQKVKHHLEES
jgi:RNA polymerase sigma factor (sigma-70 family)